MKIKLICIGNVRDKEIGKAIDNYAGRIPHYWPFGISNLSDVRTGKSIDASRQKEMEGLKILSEIGASDFVVLLDERGKEFTSREFAEFIDKKSVVLPRNLVFVVGGPYGFSKEVYNRADMMISLSKMTFPHELVRLFFVEQLYRAGTILRGEPYHHD